MATMKILLVAATQLELNPSIDYLQNQWTKTSFSEFTNEKLNIFPLITGVGSTLTAFALARFKQIQHINLLIHAGVAGSYNRNLALTQIIEVYSEQWGDLGAEDKNGNFMDVFKLGLHEPDLYPYQHGILLNDQNIFSTGLVKVKGLTVNKTSGHANHIEALQNQFGADIESMEGAGLFYACKVMDVPFLSLRAISNYVEPRDKTKWQLEESIHSLNRFIIQFIEKLQTASS